MKKVLKGFYSNLTMTLYQIFTVVKLTLKMKFSTIVNMPTIGLCLTYADLAENVKKALLPKDAKRVTKVLDSIDLENCESQKMTSMESILRAKYDSCKEFCQALMNFTSHPYWESVA